MNEDRVYEDPGDPLDMLAEECAEVIKEIMKLKRFGPYKPSPLDGSTPCDRLIQEMGDVKVVIEIIVRQRLHGIQPKDIMLAEDHKYAKLAELFGPENMTELCRDKSA